MIGRGRENNIKFQIEHPKEYQELLEKISKANKGKNLSTKTKIKISQSMSKIRQGKDNPAYGRKWMYKYLNGKLDKRYIHKDDIQYFLDNGYKFGKK